MNNRYVAQHQSDAIAALISGALTNPHLPGEPTHERAREVLPWLERETSHPITWQTRTTPTGSAWFAGHITAADPEERHTAIAAWAAVIGSWSISDEDGVMGAIGRYQGFSVELTATP